MKFLKYFILILLLLVVAGAIYVATQDNNYHVTRSKLMNTSQQLVFDEVNDFKNWESWSPWLETDTLAKLTFKDITSGVNAGYAWDGEILGSGNMKTVGVSPNDSIAQEITFTAPWESNSDVYWTFKPAEGGTNVTWGMKGEMGFMMKASMLFMGGMDNQIGPDYERGLFKLDSILQVKMNAYSVEVNGVTTHGGGYYIFNSASTSMDKVGIKIQELLPKVGMYAAQNKVAQAGMPFSLYHQWDQTNNSVVLSCAVPVSEKIKLLEGSDIQLGQLAPFNAVKVTLKGNYSNLQAAWTKAYAYIEEKGLEAIANKPAMEVYANDPGQFPNPADWITELYIPVK